MIEIVPGCAELLPDFMSEVEATALYLTLREAYARVFRRGYEPAPGNPLKLHFVLHPVGHFYDGFGNHTNVSPISEHLVKATARANEACQVVGFNNIFANAYRDGRDWMRLHSDTEPELGVEPTVGTLSLGSPRAFGLARRGEAPRVVVLPPGSMLIMKGRCQADWEHGILEEPAVTAPRISLTFRTSFKFD